MKSSAAEPKAFHTATPPSRKASETPAPTSPTEKQSISAPPSPSHANELDLDTRIQALPQELQNWILESTLQAMLPVGKNLTEKFKNKIDEIVDDEHWTPGEELVSWTEDKIQAFKDLDFVMREPGSTDAIFRALQINHTTRTAFARELYGRTVFHSGPTTTTAAIHKIYWLKRFTLSGQYKIGICLNETG